MGYSAGEGSKYPGQKREQDLLKAKRQDDNFLWEKKIIKLCAILALHSTKASILWVFFSVTLECLLAYWFITDRLQYSNAYKSCSLNIFGIHMEMSFIKTQLFTGFKRISVHLGQKANMFSMFHDTFFTMLVY